VSEFGESDRAGNLAEYLQIPLRHCRGNLLIFVGMHVRKQFFPAQFDAFENIFFNAPSAATSTQAGGSRESIRSYRQPFKTTRPDPFDTSASRRKIGDSLEVATSLRV